MAFTKGMTPHNSVNEIEQARALGMLIRHKGDYRRAAAELGVSDSTLRHRVERAKERGIKPRIVVGGNLPPPETIEPIPARVQPPKTVKKDVQNSRILLISDLHCPYQHQDALAFLTALKEKYNFDRIICVGDEIDGHSRSFHSPNPDLDSAGREHQKAQEVLCELAAIFPKMDLLHSNHGDLLYRKAIEHGIPRHMVAEYKDVIFAIKQEDGSYMRPRGRGDDWIWHKSLVVDLPTGGKMLVVHGMSISTIRNVEQSGISFAQGHHHGRMEVVFNGTPEALNWGITVGCLIDDRSMAFAYNRNTLKRPIIGCGAVIDGFPKLLPMVLERGNRWTGFVP